MNRWIRRAGTLLVAGVLTGVGFLDVASAQSIALTSNIGNSVSTLEIAPPTRVTISASSNVFPLLTCTVTVSWTASTTSEIDGYEVRRVDIVNGEQPAVAQSSSPFVDPVVPLLASVAGVEWQVRSVLGTWHSDWVTPTSSNLVPCVV